VEFARLLRELQPKAFIMENVRGMTIGKMRLVFVEALKLLRSCGYRVSARVLDASWYGVPQQRQRLIVAGVRSSSEQVPEPLHPAPRSARVTVRQAFAGLADDESARWVPKSGSLVDAAMLRVPPGKVSARYFSKKRLAYDACSFTLTRIPYDFWHPKEHRPITTHEAKRLASFPDEFFLSGTVGQIFDRVGNSVPPLFMYAIAKHLKEIGLFNA